LPATKYTIRAMNLADLSGRVMQVGNGHAELIRKPLTEWVFVSVEIDY
jgi:hypothetical protein